MAARWHALLVLDLCCNILSPLDVTWWRHQMETFSALLAPCEGNPPLTGGFPSQRPVTQNFDDLRLNIQFSKQSRRWWFEAPSLSLWRHCDEISDYCPKYWFLLVDTHHVMIGPEVATTHMAGGDALIPHFLAAYISQLYMGDWWTGFTHHICG